MIDRTHPPKNSILTIQPYRLGGIWVFDFAAFDLIAEAFVGDINKMIDAMLDRADLPRSEPFTAMFSASPFPGAQMKLMWSHEEHDGNWYTDSRDFGGTGVLGWLCPVLCMFFGKAPKNIYVRAEA